MSITVNISIGEFLDKLSILKIKLDKITDPDKNQNIKKEHALYVEQLKQADFLDQEIYGFLKKLEKVNLALWEIEEAIRIKEENKKFDEEFIELARSVYKNNDLRAEIKRQINQHFRSDLVEEKSYQSAESGDS